MEDTQPSPPAAPSYTLVLAAIGILTVAYLASLAIDLPQRGTAAVVAASGGHSESATETEHAAEHEPLQPPPLGMVAASLS